MTQNKVKLFLPLFVCVVAWMVVYWQPLNNMVATWLSSETYKHCFFILPIALYLIYEKRDHLGLIEIKPAYWLLVPLLLGQIAYLFAELMGINLFLEICAYGSLICLIWLVFGTQMIKALMFPLFYLVLAIPMGEELVPALQNVTADISVFLVKLTGIPVYREGLYIYVSNGTFEVAEACAGIRFLIATIAIGFLYAYLFYRSFWRRTVFVLLCIAIPILANGIRAYGIIAIGHYSNMEHAVGADHLVYGWFFFAFILLLLMAIGRFWREDTVEEELSTDQSTIILIQQKRSSVVLLSLLVLSFKPVYEYTVIANPVKQVSVSTAIENAKGTFNSITDVSWQPRFSMATQSYFGISADDNSEIFIGYYPIDNSTSELISWSNQIYFVEQWSKIKERNIQIENNAETISAKLLFLTNAAGQQKNILYWYQVGEYQSFDKLRIKFAQLFDKLSGGTGGGHIIAISLGNNSDKVEDYEQFLKKYNMVFGNRVQ
ncbi:exosortase A [Colwelliaceae bacterium 6471]